MEALHALHILDTPPESVFDEAAALAANICGTPIALVNLLDGDRQWFKARVGIEASELPREQSFCDHLVGKTRPLVVPDTAADARFSTSPFVTGDNGLRFYAGMPLNTAEGHTLGTLCVADTVPHHLSGAQIDALGALGRQVATQIELRAKVELLAKVIEEKERAERELRHRTLLFSAFMEHSPTIGFIKDHDGRFLYYNGMFCDRFAVSPTEWIGKNVFDLFPGEFAQAYHDLDMAVLRSGVSQVVEETSPGPDGATLYWRTHKFCIADNSGENLLGGLSLDISTEREFSVRLQHSHAGLEQMNERLTELAVTDGLTKLRNRRAFDEQLDREIGQDLPLSLILIDIDHFKSLNDGYGHPAGDEVLRTVAQLLMSGARDCDCVARFGGEEFAILLHTGMERANAIAERLRAAVESFAWKDRAITISAGVATRCIDLCSAAELLDAADTALYIAKHRGRNRIECAVRDGARDIIPQRNSPEELLKAVA